jgi:hypothetical protein
MKIEFSKGQFRELIRLVMLGANVETSVLEEREEPYEHVYDLEEYLLSKADDFELDGMVEKKAGEFFPSKKLEADTERIMREYDDDTFWFKLETELGQRDFYETLSFKELRAIKEGQVPMPDAVKELYEKYADEFDRYRISRLRIVAKAAKE